jgi:hypothetical protein
MGIWTRMKNHMDKLARAHDAAQANLPDEPAI